MVVSVFTSKSLSLGLYKSAYRDTNNSRQFNIFSLKSIQDTRLNDNMQMNFIKRSKTILNRTSALTCANFVSVSAKFEFGFGGFVEERLDSERRHGPPVGRRELPVGRR